MYYISRKFVNMYCIYLLLTWSFAHKIDRLYLALPKIINNSPPLSVSCILLFRFHLSHGLSSLSTFLLVSLMGFIPSGRLSKISLGFASAFFIRMLQLWIGYAMKRRKSTMLNNISCNLLYSVGHKSVDASNMLRSAVCYFAVYCFYKCILICQNTGHINLGENTVWPVLWYGSTL